MSEHRCPGCDPGSYHPAEKVKEYFDHGCPVSATMAVRDIRKALLDYYGANFPQFLLEFIDGKLTELREGRHV